MGKQREKKALLERFNWKKAGSIEAVQVPEGKRAWLQLLHAIVKEHETDELEYYGGVQPGAWVVKFTAFNSEPIWFVLPENVGTAILRRPPKSYWEHIS